MSPTPSPTPLEVLIQSGPAEWWQVLAALGPLAILTGALLAAAIGWRTLRQRTAADALALAQKSEADIRAEWWKRTQWAIDSSMSDDPDRAKLGLGLMEVLASTAPGTEEIRIITVAWKDPLEVAAQQLAPDNPTSAESVWKPGPGRSADDAGGVSSHRQASHDRGVQIAAAKLRVATDRRLGQTTPGWLRELAAEP